eukprot:g25956.t1
MIPIAPRIRAAEAAQPEKGSEQGSDAVQHEAPREDPSSEAESADEEDSEKKREEEKEEEEEEEQQEEREVQAGPTEVSEEDGRRWFVKNTFIDVSDSDSDSLPAFGSVCSCPAGMSDFLHDEPGDCRKGDGAAPSHEVQPCGLPLPFDIHVPEELELTPREPGWLTRRFPLAGRACAKGRRPSELFLAGCFELFTANAQECLASHRAAGNTTADHVTGESGAWPGARELKARKKAKKTASQKVKQQATAEAAAAALASTAAGSLEEAAAPGPLNP